MLQFIIEKLEKELASVQSSLHTFRPDGGGWIAVHTKNGYRDITEEHRQEMRADIEAIKQSIAWLKDERREAA